MKSQDNIKIRQTFTPVSAGIECLFFMKTMEPIEPGALVLKMCEDAQACLDPRSRRCKYINRLTPVFDTEKATENGINKVARGVLSSTFHLKDESTTDRNQCLEAVAPVDFVPAYTVYFPFTQNHCLPIANNLWLIIVALQSLYSTLSATIFATIRHSSQTMSFAGLPTS